MFASSWTTIPATATMEASNNRDADYNVEDIRQEGSSSKSTTSQEYWCSETGAANAVLTITFSSPVRASGFRVKPHDGYVNNFFNGYTLRVDDELIASEDSTKHIYQLSRF